LRFPSVDPPDSPGNSFPLEPFDASFVYPAPRRKFQSRVWLHAVLLLLTVATTTLVGALHYAAYISQFPGRRVAENWSFLLHGFWYSGTLLSILGAHEMGHYVLCRRYNVDASLPYFIPVPPFSFFSLTGTLGAVIRIREAFPSRKVLFDVGVAGPIAGFAVLVPALLFGLTLSNVVPEPKNGLVLILGEPLLFKIAARAFFGALQDGYTINIHPMVFASWFGMLATALNLLPFGQLDGGHITYATLGRFSTRISLVTVGTAVAMTFLSLSWLLFTVIMVAMVFLFGPHHPRVLNEYEPIGHERILIAVFALIMLVLCFTPVPLDVRILTGR
jgi:membrane-associated protease RseP (regulator of RpoE activity)